MIIICVKGSFTFQYVMLFVSSLAYILPVVQGGVTVTIMIISPAGAMLEGLLIIIRWGSTRFRGRSSVYFGGMSSLYF